MSKPLDFGLSCPLPMRDYPTILLAHGGGGRLMHQLIDGVFSAAFPNPLPNAGHDGAVIDFRSILDAAVAGVAETGGGASKASTRRLPGRANEAERSRIAFTTDSYVVRPLFFPGGDIGSLAVNGTVNDLAMCGARALYLSCGFILEEGLAVVDLWRIVQTMKTAAEAAGVAIVTGDTKVVDRGKGDGVYLNTAGIGIVEHDGVIGPESVRPGDVVLLNGDVGRHGIAIMAVREGLEFESTIESDCAPLVRPVLDLLEAGIEVHCLRDCTRGGLATTLVEIAESAGVFIQLDERAIPVHEEVRGACEILGFDPLYVANEGRFLAIVAEKDADRALEILRRNPTGGRARDMNGSRREGSPSSLPRPQSHPESQPAVIGKVIELKPGGRLTLKSAIGATRILDMLSGEQLPRIC